MSQSTESEKNPRNVQRASEESLQKIFRDTHHIRNNGGVTYIK